MDTLIARITLQDHEAVFTARSLAEVELAIRRALENESFDVGVVDVRVEPA